MYVFNSYNEIYYHIDKYLHTQKAEKKHLYNFVTNTYS
jgi:hypothetical protein